MPICQTCEGNEFQLYDGFYYCSICNTQSQDIIEEVENEDAQASKMSSLTVKSHRKRTSLSSFRTARESDQNRTSTELFTTALNFQINFFIAQGMDPRIKDVVFKLWAIYLQKNELAFCGKTAQVKGWVPRLYPQPRECDLKLYQPAKRKIAKKSKKDKTKKKKKQVESDVEPDLSESGISSDLESLLSRADSDLSYFTSEGETSGMENSFTSDEENIFEKQKKRKLCVSKISKVEKKHKKSVLCRMNFRRTLSFCYLGLCMLGKANRYYCIGDILRWICENHFPYTDIVHRLSEKYTLTENEARLFIINQDRNKIFYPTFDIVNDAEALAKFLDLPATIGVTVEYLVDKYVTDLNLPYEIAKLAKNLLKDWHLSNLKSRELAPIVCILMVLKELFKLNDIFEKELSKACQEINSENENDSPDCPKLFVWDDWVQHTKARVKYLTDNHFAYWKRCPKFHDPRKSYRYFKFKTQCYTRPTSKEDNFNFVPSMKKPFEEMGEIVEAPEPEPHLLPWKHYSKFYSEIFPSPSVIHLNFSDHSVKYDIFEGNNEFELDDSNMFWRCRALYAKEKKKVNDVINEIPASYRWLLSVVSMLTEVPESEIFNEVTYNEHTLG